MVALLAGLLGWLAATPGGQGPPPPQPPQILIESLAGSDSFALYCATCHGTDGRGVTSHGDREMPIWGDAFRTTRGGLSASAAEARIDAIVRYLRAIQERAAEE